MMRLRATLLAGMLLAAALVLTGCPMPNRYTAVQVFHNVNLDGMVGLQPIPGDPGKALVLTQHGIIYRANLNDASDAPSVFLDISGWLIPGPGTEEGLLGLAYAPDYASSGTFYVYYTAGGPRHNRVSRFTAHGATADAASEQVVIDLPEKRFPNHNGGALAFGPDGDLYIGVGDGGGGGDPDGNGQNTNSLLGKILRIDVSGGGTYRIPNDNPFAHGGGRGEVYAFGLRNPWRINVDTVSGQLWAGDVGQNLWEEVDRIVAGANYGWHVMEGNHCYQPADGCDRSGLLPPRAEYSHDFGCSVTGGFVYRGASMPELDGWYVYGDYCSGRVWAVDIASNNGAAIPLADTHASITSFAQDGAGEVYLVTFNNKILKLARQ
jgi:glucose/arabinose dehydrogenase